MDKPRKEWREHFCLLSLCLLSLLSSMLFRVNELTHFNLHPHGPGNINTYYFYLKHAQRGQLTTFIFRVFTAFMCLLIFFLFMEHTSDHSISHLNFFGVVQNCVPIFFLFLSLISFIVYVFIYSKMQFMFITYIVFTFSSLVSHSVSSSMSV